MNLEAMQGVMLAIAGAQDTHPVLDQIVEGIAALVRHQERGVAFEAALERAAALGRRLVVIGFELPLFGTALRGPRLAIPGIHGSLAIAGTPIVGRALSLVGGTSELELFLPADPRLQGLELVQQPLFVSAGSGDRFWLGNVVGGPITL